MRHPLTRLAAITAISLSIGLPAHAQTDASADRRGPGLLVTHADASRRLPNTVADVVVSIEVHGRDLRSTASQLAQQSKSLQDYLHGQKTDRLRTEIASFTPEVQDVRTAPDRIKGYVGAQAISFRTTPDQLSAVLAGSLDNGATGVTQTGASPREEEIAAAQADLVAQAAKSAMAQARTVAQAVGQRVTGVERLDVEPQGGPVGPVMNRAMAAAPMASARIAPIATVAGEAEIRATVRLTARIGPAD